MDAVRDPAYDEPWRDTREPWRASLEPWRMSLERSRARRGKPMPSSAELTRWTAAPARLVNDGRRRARPSTRRRHPLVVPASLAAVLLVLLLAGAQPGASDGFALQALLRSGRLAHNEQARHARSRLAVPASRAPVASTAVSCEQAGAAGYVNPLAGTTMSPKRIDQGVDYTAGTGTLKAIGPGTVTVVALTDTGWPGAFVEYRLRGGPAAGCSVFYAEGISPLPDVQVGDEVRPGQPIATIIPGYSSGIEIGWGAGSGTKTYAAMMGEWSATAEADNIPTAAGISFSALVAALGGPPGRIENVRR